MKIHSQFQIHLRILRHTTRQHFFKQLGMNSYEFCKATGMQTFETFETNMNMIFSWNTSLIQTISKMEGNGDINQNIKKLCLRKRI